MFYPKMPIGVQIEGSVPGKVKWIGQSSWVVSRIYWNEVETIPGVYNWPDHYQIDIDALKNWPILLNIKSCPTWARLYPKAECSRPKKKYAKRFIDFCEEVVRKFHPQAISIWNEPEVSAMTAYNYGYDHNLGGFGIENAKFYGKLVNGVYRRIAPYKVKVIAGELLSTNDNRFWKLASRYACRGYDAVAFHSYTEYASMYDVIPKRIKILRRDRETKPLWCTETSYLSHNDGTYASTFEQDQANYLKYILDNRNNWSCEQIAWYTLANNGWRRSDLVEHSVEKPVYTVYLSSMINT